MGCNTSKDTVLQPVDGAISNDEQQQQQEEQEPGEEAELEAAATKIQAAFRGSQIRKELKTLKEDSPPTSTTMDPTTAELEAEFSPEDKELCHAATKIQASFRGHMARKQHKDDDKPEDAKPEDELSHELEKLNAKQTEAEELDIDLSDPELHKAATKIQASFRGHKVRKDGEPSGQ